ncbi:uncharacterized protein H6S33_006823 [Morchella sextelata]|uniref:uncharacterized protein n=1 Tax=Morchella sextelata TaxID=1174677 RepID=UPI001D03759E|nr:uncharacterized protein H6S33_006823 [Morchella sextelata]KAH0604446.1 hypothetical protein H6S33_006823 [Morchella sextelata]
MSLFGGATQHPNNQGLFGQTTPPAHNHNSENISTSSDKAQTYKRINVYFPYQNIPFIIPYQPNNYARCIGNQVKDKIDLIALGMKSVPKDWVLISALSPPESNAKIEMIHGSCLPILADAFIKPDGAYLLLWTSDSWNAKELVRSGLELISG